MVEAILKALIVLCVVVMLFFLVLWVMGEIGIVVPAMVISIAKVILVLVCILVLYRMLKPVSNGWLP